MNELLFLRVETDPYPMAQATKICIPKNFLNKLTNLENKFALQWVDNGITMGYNPPNNFFLPEFFSPGPFL